MKTRELMKAYHQFLGGDQDRTNRDSILAELKNRLRDWFTHGVKYNTEAESDGACSLLGIPRYKNAPEGLTDALEIAQGKITMNILTYLKIPQYSWTPLLMIAPAVPLGGKKESKAAFSLCPLLPPLAVVYETEGKPIETRVNTVANRWYDSTAFRVLVFITEKYELGDERPSSLRQVRENLDREAKLRELNLDLPAELIYHAHRLGFKARETAEALRNLGIAKSPEAIKKFCQRSKEELGKFQNI